MRSDVGWSGLTNQWAALHHSHCVSLFACLLYLTVQEAFRGVRC